MHETQKDQLNISDEKIVIHEDLLPLQRIESGGPLKQADLSTMPKPIRMFAYFIFGFILVSVFLLIIISILK